MNSTEQGEQHSFVVKRDVEMGTISERVISYVEDVESSVNVRMMIGDQHYGYPAQFCISVGTRRLGFHVDTVSPVPTKDMEKTAERYVVNGKAFADTPNSTPPKPRSRRLTC